MGCGYTTRCSSSGPSGMIEDRKSRGPSASGPSLRPTYCRMFTAPRRSGGERPRAHLGHYASLMSVMDLWHVWVAASGRRDPIGASSNLRHCRTLVPRIATSPAREL
ncbi:hypothetical protein BD414DRAFT_503086 [Trametes punicea]|nr:hypothetical protein BD414DRAFT_503086 [Trametes punicea]